LPKAFLANKNYYFYLRYVKTIMKNSLLYLIITALLFFTVTPAFAGFWVKKTASVVTAGANTTSSGETQTGAGKILSNYRLQKKVYPNRYRYRDRTYKQGQWIAIVAFSCGVLGLFIPGLNFAAILFGLLGIGKGSKLKGLAVAGFILGVLELLLFLIAGTVFISLIV
jgi:hypothetical protein